MNGIKNTPGEHQNRAREPVSTLPFKERITEKFQNANNYHQVQKEREKRNQMKEKQHIQDSSQQQNFKMLKKKKRKKKSLELAGILQCQDPALH